MTAREEAVLRVVVAGGGTGGHLYPGIAVARELMSRRPCVVTFAGTSRGVESTVVPREGFALDVIRSGGLKGKSLSERAKGLAMLPVSVVDAWGVVSSRRPALVIGVGGYSSGPVVAVAALRGIPTMLLEQNAVPGLTNRLLAPLVRAAAVTFEQTRVFFGEKAVLAGNPVRQELFGVTPSSQPAAGGDPQLVRLLVFGGSQGAHAINVALAGAASRLASATTRVHVTHQTGPRDVELVRTAYAQAGLTATVEPYFYDMARQLAEADLVVCRAGATTLAELAASGRPAILIPLPTATDDHQRKNAEAVASTGAAEVLLQADASPARVAERILALADDARLRSRMSEAARRLARPDAAKVIVDRAFELVAGAC